MVRFTFSVKKFEKWSSLYSWDHLKVLKETEQNPERKKKLLWLKKEQKWSQPGDSWFSSHLSHSCVEVSSHCPWWLLIASSVSALGLQGRKEIKRYISTHNLSFSSTSTLKWSSTGTVNWIFPVSACMVVEDTVCKGDSYTFLLGREKRA